MERLRRRVLDLFFKRGYELVMPPLLEYMDSLLTGTGHDLELRTFKVVDQFSGRMMGVRADITPQVARIDAHLLNRKGVTRLCYCGSVLHTRPAAPGATREPIQLGAEIYGAAGVEADLEIQRLLCDALRLAQLRQLRQPARRRRPDQPTVPDQRREATVHRDRALLPRPPGAVAGAEDPARPRQGLPGARELRSRRAARLPLPLRCRLRCLLRGRQRPRRARRALRRGGQGLRPRAAGDWLLH